MNVRLRWILALSAVGVLGFAAGRYFGLDELAPTFQMKLPVLAPTSSTPSDFASPASANPRQVPRTLHEIMKLPGDFTQSTALYVLAASSDRQGIERLLDEADAIGRDSERRAATLVLYQRYAELNPEAAVKHVLAREAGFDPNWLHAIYHVWARADLDGALAHAAKLDDQERLAAGTAIVRSRDDLSRTERETMVSQLNVPVAVRDPSAADLGSPQVAERAWRGALAITDRKVREQELFRITRAWALKDPRATIRAIESHQNRNERDHLIDYAVRAWAEKDPRLAVEWVLERPPTSRRAELLSSTLGSLAMKDPLLAVAILEQLPRTEQQQVLSSVLMHWANVDAPSAAEWAVKNERRSGSPYAFMMVVNTFARQDPVKAFQWATTLSGEQRQVVMGQVIQFISQVNPERAGDLVDRMDEGPHRQEAISHVAQGLAANDPRAALAWVARQSGADITPEVYARIFVEWAPYDADGAVSQLNFILEPAIRNAAIRGILQGANLDPGFLDQIFQRLEGAEATQMAATIVYNRLQHEDPERAERYRVLARLPPTQGEGNPIVD